MLSCMSNTIILIVYPKFQIQVYCAFPQGVLHILRALSNHLAFELLLLGISLENQHANATLFRYADD